jgi:aminoglycoside phosphotransferase (APT) family kinase protein
MHPDDWPMTAGLARRLLAAQMHDLADLPLRGVASAGTDNVLFRLGDGLSLRFPRTGHAGGLIAKESRWLPVLAPLLPLPVPCPLRVGLPDFGYPHDWSVTPWLPGQDAQTVPPDQTMLAQDLAGFIRALRAVDPGLAGGDPPRGRGGLWWNGTPLSAR